MDKANIHNTSTESATLEIKKGDGFFENECEACIVLSHDELRELCLAGLDILHKKHVGEPQDYPATAEQADYELVEDVFTPTQEDIDAEIGQYEYKHEKEV